MVTAREKRRGKEDWSQDCGWNGSLNDSFAMALNCGPSDVGDPHAVLGDPEYDSPHLGATADDIATRPKLVIDYVPEPATFSLVGVGMFALLRRQRMR